MLSVLVAVLSCPGSATAQTVLDDVTVVFQRAEFNATNLVFSIEAVLRNDSATETVPQDARLVILSTGHESIVPLDADGTHPTLTAAFYVFSAQIPAAGLAPGEASDPRRIRFLNENNFRVRLTTQTESVADTAPPEITCPDPVVEGVTDPGGTAVTYPEILVTDALDPSPILTCTPEDGSVFEPGTTAVECTATDVDGNASRCSFDVTVNLETRGGGGGDHASGGGRFLAPAGVPDRIARVTVIVDDNGEAVAIVPDSGEPPSAELRITGGEPGAEVEVALFGVLMPDTPDGFAGDKVIPLTVQVTSDMAPGTFAGVLQLCPAPSDVEDLDFAAWRLHHFDPESERWIPAGVRDRGLSAPTNAVGDFGIDPESMCVWAVVDHFSAFAAGLPVRVALSTRVEPPDAGTIIRVPDVAEHIIGTIATLTAAATSDARVFAGWIGDIEADSPTVEIVMDAPKTVTAVFAFRPDAPPESTDAPSTGSSTPEPEVNPLPPCGLLCGPLGFGELLCMLFGLSAIRSRTRQ